MTRRRAFPAVLCALLLTLLAAVPAAALPLRSPGAERAGDQSGDDSALQAGGRLHLAVGSMQPKVVTSNSHRLTVSGVVTNTGDRVISDIELRLQLADPVGSKQQLVSAMHEPPVNASSHSGFHRLAHKLEPGRSAKFRVSVDLSTSGLAVSTPGIYPLTVNVNGRPDYGGDARLTSLNTLLPVRSAPGSGSAAERGSHSSFGMTMLWPIAAKPRQLGRTPSGKPILADDSLAGQMAPGGRLDALVKQGQKAVADPQLRRSMCFAVDPEIVQIAAAMRGGYVVRAGKRTVAGKGAHAASGWLGSLAELTKGHCVVPLPYAQADLTALSRAGAVGLEHQALDTSTLRDYLPGAQLLENVVAPDDGMLDERTMSDIVDTRSTTALVQPRNILAEPTSIPQTIGGIEGARDGRTAQVLTTDALLDAGLGGVAEKHQGDQEFLTPASTPAVASQNGIATLIYREQFDPQPPRNVVAMPPARWNTSPEDLTAWLNAVRGAFADHAAYPVALPDSLQTPPSGTTSLSYPTSAESDEIPRSVTARVVKDNAEVRDLVGALHKDAAGSVSPVEATAGIQEGLLRAVSGAWRGNENAARAAVRDATRRLRAFTERVRVGSSSLPLSLATKQSQIPVSVSNSLPVNVRVRIFLDSPGLRTPGDYTEKVIPAHNSRTVLIPVTVQRSGRFNVDIRLTTPGNTPLGKEVRVDVTSSAFGMVTLIITITAFAALVLLAGRRIYRRVRTARAGGGR